MLSQKELSSLYQLISDDSQTFEKISEEFFKTFKNENQSKVGMTLLFLLKDNLLNIHQRIISYYILYEISKNDKPESNPYISIILQMLEKSKNKNEKSFLVDFLYKRINYSKMNARNYLEDNTRELKVNIVQILIQWNKLYNENIKMKNIYLNSNDKIKSIIYDRKNVDINNLDNHTNLNLLGDGNNAQGIEKELNPNYFIPNFMSYYPGSNNTFINSEPVWICPQLKHIFVWEKNLENNEIKK